MTNKKLKCYFTEKNKLLLKSKNIFLRLEDKKVILYKISKKRNLEKTDDFKIPDKIKENCVSNFFIINYYFIIYDFCEKKIYYKFFKGFF